MKLEEGKIYKIDISRCPSNYPCGHFIDFEKYDNHEICTLNIEGEEEYAVFYNGWYFSKELLVEVVGKTANRVQKEDRRKYKDFKVGDLVRIRTINDLKEHFYFDSNKIYTHPLKYDIEALIKMERKTAIITGVDGAIVYLNFEGEKDDELYYFLNSYNYCSELLEIVEEGYTQRMEKALEEKRQKIKKATTTSEEEIINEMLKKVDIEKVKKILSGALRMKASSLLGLDKLLLDWAKAKKDIYVALGRNLTIRKDIEYEMGYNELQEAKSSLLSKFPRFLWCFERHFKRGISKRIYK